MNILENLFLESKLTQAEAFRIAQKINEDSKSATIVVYDDDNKNYIVFRQDDYDSLIGTGKIDKTEYQMIKQFEALEEETPEEDVGTESEEEVDLDAELGGGGEEEVDLDAELGEEGNNDELSSELTDEDLNIGNESEEEEIDLGDELGGGEEETKEEPEEEFDFTEA